MINPGIGKPEKSLNFEYAHALALTAPNSRKQLRDGSWPKR
jgi:hypothetical protein